MAKRRMRKVKTKAALLLATWFGCGYSPVAPGTVGSLAGLLGAWLLHQWRGWEGPPFLLLALALALPGIWAAGAAARHIRIRDPGIVVVDEVAGQWIALAGATELSWKGWLGAFLLFRLFDIWKPWPVRQLERIPGGGGIVADDVMAGAYGAVILYAAGRFGLY